MESVIKALTKLNQNQMETLQISIFFPCDFPGFFFLQFPLLPLPQVSSSTSPFPQIQTSICLPSEKSRPPRDIDQTRHSKLFDQAHTNTLRLNKATQL